MKSHISDLKSAICLLVVGVLLTAGVIHAQPAATTQSSRNARDPGEIRRGFEMGGNREERSRRVYETILRKVEPSLSGDVKRLNVYLEFFKREFVEDPRQFAISLQPVEAGNGKWHVSGYVEYIEHQRALAEVLRHLSLDESVEDRTQLLPTIGVENDRYALVTAERCFVHDRSEGRGEVLTECVAGDALFVLKDDQPGGGGRNGAGSSAGTDAGDERGSGGGAGGRVLVHAKSGYVGWVDSACLVRVGKDGFDKQINAKPPDPRIDTVIATAKSKLGIKYVWGGLTDQGMDCSGLVNLAYRSAGVTLPRDADQQSLVGSLVATRWHRSAMRKGDVMFFLSRRGTISHTAIYLGDNQYIEATDPGVKITSLDEKSEDYERRRDEGFAFAKRVLE